MDRCQCFENIKTNVPYKGIYNDRRWIYGICIEIYRGKLEFSEVNNHVWNIIDVGEGVGCDTLPLEIVSVNIKFWSKSRRFPSQLLFLMLVHCLICLPTISDN